MKPTTTLFLLIAFIIYHSSFIAQAQRLDKAAEVQLEKQIRTKLTNFIADIEILVNLENEQDARERYVSKMLNYGLHPQITMVQEFEVGSISEVPLRRYFEQVRTLYKDQKQAFKMSINESSFKYLPPKIIGDSLEVEVFYTQEIPNNPSYPIRMILTARKGKDLTAGPYFTNIRIAGTKKAIAPIEAKPFVSSKTDVYQVYLDEQSLSAVIERVAAGMADKIPANVAAVQVSRFSYAGCNIYDKFAREFSVTLANKLSSLRPNVQFSTEGSQAQTYEIRGQYETRGDKLGIEAELYDPTGKPLAQANNADLPLKWFDANKVAFIPPDYKRTAEEQRVITQNMVSGAENLNIELSTNKGRRGLLFKAGDPMNIYVQVNRPCKVRVIYKDAIGKLMLVRDMNLSEGMLNRAVLVEELECTKPFGNETLIAYATTDKFASLNVQNERFKIEGLEYEQDIIKNTLEEAVKTMKEEGVRGGAKKVNNGTPTFGSTQLQLQTVEK